jgi:O-glycosyl hydrolase
MKTNDSLDNSRHEGRLRRAGYQPLARYFVKFLRAYGIHGVPVAAVTPANEPDNPTTYPGLEMSAQDETEFVVRNLVPALRDAGLNTKLYLGDTGFSSTSTEYVNELVRGPAEHVVSGIAWHCYFGSPGVMGAAHWMIPKLEQIGSECSPGVAPLPMPEVVISELRNWARVVAFWNLALDPRHGPVQLPDHGCPSCTGLVNVDERSHTFTFDRSYFELGQASAFVEPGAWRIRSDHFVTYSSGGPAGGGNYVRPGLDDVAFRNPDGSEVLLAYNSASHPKQFAVEWRRYSFAYTLAPGAMVTFRWLTPAHSRPD